MNKRLSAFAATVDEDKESNTQLTKLSRITGIAMNSSTQQEPLELSLSLKKKTNELHNITCYEPVDRVLLGKLLNTDLLLKNLKNPMARDMIGSEKKQLTLYKSKLNMETGLAEVQYLSNDLSYGRIHPKGSLGLFSMRKTIRHTIATRAGLSDWDIVNAHPEILLQICQANGLACNNLNTYVTNRDALLTRLMTITSCGRDRAKELFIRLLYFGSFENWLIGENEGEKVCSEISIYVFQNDQDFTAYIHDLSKELHIIGKHIVHSNPSLVKEIEKNKQLKRKGPFNKMATVVSFFLQEYEVRVLESLYTYCCEKQYIRDNICVLCADGIMLKEEWITGVDLPSEFNEVVLEKVGLNLRFLKKELDQSLSDEDIESHTISSKMLDQSKFQNFNVDYFHSLDGYRRRMIYFEMFVCKVLRPDPVYIYIESDNGLDEMCFYNQSKISEAFKHLNSGEYDRDGNDIKFMPTWLDDPSIRCFNKMDFRPFNENEVIPDHIFNLFRGFNPNCKSEYDYEKRDKLLKPFLDLGKELCGGDDRYFGYLLKYIADIFQNPRRKNPIAFIIKGKQGTGKNVWLNSIGNSLGRQHYITSSNPKDFFGEYAEGFYHKLLVNMNECEGKDTFEFEGRIKSFITEDSITLNRKFVQPITISNLARLVIFSNKPNPIPIDIRSKDRRYVVYETTEKYLDSKYGTSFWMSLVKHFNRPDFIACLYDFFNEMDICDFDWKSERPITKAYLQMCKLYVPVEVLFMENKLVAAMAHDATHSNLILSNKHIFLTRGIPGQDLYHEYTEYCKEFGFYNNSSYQKDIKHFYSKMADLEFPMIQKKPSNVITFYFEISAVMKFMKDRKWIDRSDSDVYDETPSEVAGDDFSELFDI